MRTRFQQIPINLPRFPAGPVTGEQLDAYSRVLVNLLTLISRPSIVRCSEIDFVSEKHSGDGIPGGATYIDENNFVRVRAAGDLWAPVKIISLQAGKGSVE